MPGGKQRAAARAKVLLIVNMHSECVLGIQKGALFVFIGSAFKFFINILYHIPSKECTLAYFFFFAHV